jgi:translation initiation factor 5A
MPTRQTDVRNLQEGGYVMIDGVPCEIDQYSTAKPGKHGSAKARIECEGVFDGQKRSISQPVDASIKVPIIDRKQGQVISTDEDEAQVMDLDTYDTFTMKIGERELSENDNIEYLEYEQQRKIL